MRGLEEIKTRNERPHVFHGDSNEREQFRASTRRSPEEVQRIHGERVEARQSHPRDAVREALDAKVAEVLAVATVFDKLGIPMPHDYAEAKKLATTLAAIAIKSLDAALDADRSRRVSSEGERFLGMEGIHSAIDAQPPFLSFWQKLNDDRAAGGNGGASYKEAKLAYQGGETPNGTLTFVGKEWDGLRAVPAKPYEGRKAYHGEFKQTAEDESTVWRVVASPNGSPICYATPEAALYGARHARIHAEAHPQN